MYNKRISIVVSFFLVCFIWLCGCGKSQTIKDVENAINNIGEVTLESGELIKTASNLYDILTDKEKESVDNRTVLVQAKITYDNLIAVEKENAEQRAAEEAKKKEVEKRYEYKNKLDSIRHKMYSTAVASKNACSLILCVWHDAIWQEDNPDTEAYTKPNGVFVEDFNDALRNLFKDKIFSVTLKGINNSKKEIAELMKDLINPPDDFKEAYASLQSLYQAYLNICNCATDPSGTYYTFGSAYNSAYLTFKKNYDAFEIFVK